MKTEESSFNTNTINYFSKTNQTKANSNKKGLSEMFYKIQKEKIKEMKSAYSVTHTNHEKNNELFTKIKKIE
jgi:hypothetical protein